MPERASMDFEFKFGRTGTKRRSNAIPRIVVLGDFGRGNPGRNMQDSRRAPVSVDNFDNVLGALHPQVDIALAEPLPIEASLAFRSIDDFHPDALYAAIPQFQRLDGIRRALASPTEEAAALSQLSRLSGKKSAADVPNSDQPATDTPVESESDVFQRLLGGDRGPAPAKPATKTVDQLIRSAMGDASLEKRTATAEVATREVVSLLTATMRAVLTLAEFRALEACWRGLDWLVRRVEEDEARIEIIDAPWTQLAEEFADCSDLENFFLTRLLCDVDDEDKPDMVIGLYTVERDVDDLALLTKLGAIAARAGAVFATHAGLSLIGCGDANELDTPNNWSLPDDNATQLWREIRNHPVAEHLAMLAPRFVVRYPYGENSDSIDAFEFEEFPVKPDHEAFCWANPAWLFALGSINGSGLIDDLPMPIFDNGLGAAQQPPIESYVSDRVAALAADSGVRLLRAHRNSGAVQA